MDSSTADESPSPKSRILTHMNHSHRDSLTRYLEHHAHLSSFSARNPILTDISFTFLEIRTQSTLPLGFDISRGRRRRRRKTTNTYEIPIRPPMESWSDARPRMVAMDLTAIEALGRSDVTIKEYLPPRGLFMWVVMVATVSTFVVFGKRGNLREGGWVYEMMSLLKVPQFANVFYRIQPWVMVVMIGVHGAETVWMARTRLRRHSVPTGGVLWWMWVVSTFFEGVGSFVRFDRAVREEETKRAVGKH